MFFRPVQIGVPPALLTGYYEPEIAGALRPDDTHRFPIYRRPPGLPSGARWASRAEIENDGLLAGRGLEIAWLADPVERFFLQIQGSGRIRLPDGGIVRVGYGGKNGHDYRSVGQELVRRGLFEAHEVSADAIAGWVRANPAAGRRLLQHNPSYVFFRRLDDHPAGKGPLGAMNRPLTPGRSIAVDPDHVPLGAPVWLEKGGATPLRRLMVAQDTGSAIQGAQRADIFYGTGAEAGRAAGRVRDAGRLVVLLPVQLAHAVTAGQ
jgi:membrane-bound lytic murein transglycosylase A